MRPSTAITWQEQLAQHTVSMHAQAEQPGVAWIGLAFFGLRPASLQSVSPGFVTVSTREALIVGRGRAAAGCNIAHALNFTHANNQLSAIPHAQPS